MSYDGLLLIDKQSGMTSHDIVQRVRRLTQQRRVGHVGTLDPLATGLLVLCLGKGCKIARFLTEYDKAYEAQIRLGISSQTFDAEGVDIERLNSKDIPDVTRDRLDDALSHFSGTIQQRAPIYSAIKVNGQPLYRAARSGESVEPPVRTVTINSILIESYHAPYLNFSVRCGKGTYIRSLANDIGERLGCGAYLSQLRRTEIGKLSVADALTLTEVEQLVSANELEAHVLPPAKALELPSMVVSDIFALRIADGLRPNPSDIERVNGSFAAGEYVSLKRIDDTVLAVGVSEVDSQEISLTTKRPIYRHLRVM